MEEAVWDVLAQLGELARCPICGELMDGPAFLADCSHAFCSLCVGTALAYTNDCCPVCRTTKVTTKRVAAPVLDQMVRALKSLPNADETLERLARERTRKRAKVVAEEEDDDDEDEQGEDEKEHEESSQLSSQSSQGMRERCVDCRLMVRDLPRHAHECLNKTERERSNFAASHAPHLASKQDRAKPMAKFNYTAATSEATLRKLCADAGLSSKGKREVLQWRHRQFVELFNANLDRAEPRETDELRQELGRLEQARFPAANPFQKRNGSAAEKVPWKELTERARPPKESQKRLSQQVEAEVVEPATPVQQTSSEEWECVWSDVAGKNFYFNTVTMVGSFEPPPHMK
jgi:E3 ubiquitin-protein ligase RAD18